MRTGSGHRLWRRGKLIIQVPCVCSQPRGCTSAASSTTSARTGSGAGPLCLAAIGIALLRGVGARAQERSETLAVRFEPRGALVPARGRRNAMEAVSMETAATPVAARILSPQCAGTRSLQSDTSMWVRSNPCVSAASSRSKPHMSWTCPREAAGGSPTETRPRCALVAVDIQDGTDLAPPRTSTARGEQRRRRRGRPGPPSATTLPRACPRPPTSRDSRAPRTQTAQGTPGPRAIRRDHRHSQTQGLAHDVLRVITGSAVTMNIQDGGVVCRSPGAYTQNTAGSLHAKLVIGGAAGGVPGCVPRGVQHPPQGALHLPAHLVHHVPRPEIHLDVWIGPEHLPDRDVAHICTV